MKSIEERLAEIEIALLQLQRSALIDTQTIMQVLIDKSICEVNDIVDTRSRIESTSADISRIDQQILQLGGTISEVPDPEPTANVKSQLRQLKELVDQLSNDGLI